MSLTVTRERKLSDSHGVTPSAPLRQLRRNGGCADVAVELRGASHRAPAPTLLLPPTQASILVIIIAIIIWGKIEFFQC